MTTFTSTVGALTLPLPAGASGERIADPALDAILAFLAWSLNNDLNAKLANLPGTSAEAVPSGRAFALDPEEPRAFNGVKVPTPALFVWWPGESTSEAISTLLTSRIRVIRALYVFDELPQHDAMALRANLWSPVDGCWRKAAFHGRHPNYTPAGSTAGREIAQSTGALDTWGWSYVGGTGGMARFGIDETNDRKRGRKTSGRDYPAFQGAFRLTEIVAGVQTVDPDDVNQGVAATVKHGGAEIFERDTGAFDGG